ncbi:formyltransferase [Ottowia thiooxydans]|uniref:formyltransferase n=1 Tax=Ottowia thiooxydans TaxID=219182 RepID=UPI0003FE634D|nr:formyltransferase [Ottowia thiooxydans]
MSRAVVFAYHNVGVRCLLALLARGVEVPLVVTHTDNPNEDIWFASVAKTAALHGLRVITPEDANTAEVLAEVQAARADFLFSFYYRQMMGAPLLQSVPRGAYNMHGSLLPLYRGRVPVNWAIIRGETETGATLHTMEIKPDAGAIVDQMAVPILPDDTAQQVFEKVTVAAETVLWRSLPALLDGSARPQPQDLSKGSYFGGRKPEDGRINPAWSAQIVHDFVRALTHPYPGAFADLPQGRLRLWQTWRVAGVDNKPALAELRLHGDQMVLACPDGASLHVLAATLADAPLTPDNFRVRLGADTVTLGA